MIEVGGEGNRARCLTKEGARGVLAGALVTSQIFTAPVLRLFANDFQPNPGMILGDLTAPANVTPALITGVAFSAPTDEEDRAVMAAISSALNFTYDGSGDADTIYGWALTDGATSTANVLYAERLEQPLVMDDVNQNLTIIPVVALNYIGS